MLGLDDASSRSAATSLARKDRQSPLTDDPAESLGEEDEHMKLTDEYGAALPLLLWTRTTVRVTALVKEFEDRKQASIARSTTLVLCRSSAKGF